MTRRTRQLRWHQNTDTATQERLRHHWTFCIVNEPREIDRIRGRTFFELAPLDEYHQLAEGPVPNHSGLRYVAYTFASDVGILNSDAWGRIYQGKVYNDRDLRNISGEPEVWFQDTFVPRIT